MMIKERLAEAHRVIDRLIAERDTGLLGRTIAELRLENTALKANANVALSEENGRLLNRIAELEAALAEAKRMTALTARIAVDGMNSDEE